MLDLVKTVLNWVTLGPFKGHRTKILSTALFVLGGLKLSGKLPLDDQTYVALTTILTGAIAQTAAAHTPTP